MARPCCWLCSAELPYTFVDPSLSPFYQSYATASQHDADRA
jgi:hypothetical protein